MTACANCSRDLQPSWKYCIFCGTRTGVPLTAAIDVIPVDERSELVAAGSAAGSVAAALAAAAAPTVAATPAPAPVITPVAAPDSASSAAAVTTPVYDNTDTGVLRIEDIPDDELPADPAPAVEAPAPARVNVLAIIALILGCLLSPLAAIFGHIALAQIGRNGDRGKTIAWVAIVLGYLSLAAALVIGISYLVLNA